MNDEIKKKNADSYEIPNNVINAVPKPRVSVKLVTYNHINLFKDSIESVLMQKVNFPWEIIIEEDFSTDGTRELVFEYAKKYPNLIRVITADYNVKQKANRVRSIMACRGDYVALMDGDDYWTDPLKLQK